MRKNDIFHCLGVRSHSVHVADVLHLIGFGHSSAVGGVRDNICEVALRGRNRSRVRASEMGPKCTG